MSKVFHNPRLTRKKHSRELDHPVPQLRVENYVQLSSYLYRGSTELRKSCTTRSRAILASSYLRGASKLILDVTALRPFRRAKDYSPDHLPDIHGMRPHRWGETHQPDAHPLTWNLSQKGSLVIRWKVALEWKCVVIYG